ncbi:MAG: hypothetical protein J6Y94_01225 [Bacteriovoracaceae bacterium]|nr:hypothetical protein [Bacteriovoracaceae bacterium]
MRAYQSLSILLGLCLICGACSDDGRAGRPTIHDYAQNEDGELCSAYYSFTDETCYQECPEDTHVGSVSEVKDLLNEISAETTDPEAALVILQEIVDAAEGICIANPPKRPSQVYVKRSYCACYKGQPDILSNCSAFCANHNDQSPTLYGSVTLGPDVELNPLLGNLYNWCNAIIGDGITDPACVLQVTDGSASSNLDIAINQGGNSFKVDLSSLNVGTTYIAKIVEIKSGASSDTFQLNRIKQRPSEDNIGPLKIMPITLYSCIQRSSAEAPEGITDTATYYPKSTTQHFIYAANDRPAAINSSTSNFICHDVNLYGTTDASTFPRLEEIPRFFLLWDQTDPRFYDVRGSSSSDPSNNSLDINDIIAERLAAEYGVEQTVNIFNAVSVYNSPATEKKSLLGYVMLPWINANTKQAFCPTQAHYTSGQPIFKILRELVGTDTEGLWIARRDPETLIDANGKSYDAPTDWIFIREGILKKIWFYTEGKQLLIPNRAALQNKTIQFYWPAGEVCRSPLSKWDENTQQWCITDAKTGLSSCCAPYIRTPGQHLYTITYDESTVDLTKLRTAIGAPDKRVGCIPAINEDDAAI